MGIQNLTGVSWLRDKIIKELEERYGDLKEGLAGGVPTDEYRQFVGRCKENRRQLDDIKSIFIDFERGASDEDE